MNLKLMEKIKESLSAVLPITGIVLALTVFLIPLEIGTMAMFVFGAVMLIVGMGMFQLGAETAMTPLGEGIGVSLTKTNKITIACLVSFVMGVLITIAEPDLQILSEQVPAIPNYTIIFTVAFGVGLFLAMAVLRIIKKTDLSRLLIILYTILLIFSFFVPKEFLAVAFDSGGVTTGPITVPFIMAMGLGLSSKRGDKSASSDSFGLVALSSIGPILAVMILGFFYNPDSAEISEVVIPQVETVRDVFVAFIHDVPDYAWEVFIAMLPIAVVYAVFQLTGKKYHKRQQLRIIIGFLYTYFGLVLFLCGVNVGFAPVGSLLGKQLATGDIKWLLIPIGMLIGYFIVKAEPAIQILNHQVQTVTNGAISAKSMNRALSIGVAVSIGLAVLRILTVVPIQYIIIPGYVIALIMSLFVPKIFVGIAFDSGGVASGPMTSTFLLPLCIGCCRAVNGNIMTDAFGVVALVALTPLIAIQIMGVAYRIKLHNRQKSVAADYVIPENIDMIIEFEEEF